MSLCDCTFGPRCESNRCCADDDQFIGVKDRRTGTIRNRADYSILMPTMRGIATHLTSRSITGSYELLRPIFYCHACWKDLQDAAKIPLLGIDRPTHASDFWRPSITDHIRLTALSAAA